MFRSLGLIFAFLALLGCGEQVSRGSSARILLLGDSMMAVNKSANAAVGNQLENLLGQEVIDRSVIGARYYYLLPLTGAAGLRLTAQYRLGPWDWVILNGGGNDLLFGCGCGPCNWLLDLLVSTDGASGIIPNHVAKIRQSGARVAYVGYLRNPGSFTPIRFCAAAGNELDRRLSAMASRDGGVDFISLSTLVPEGDTSYHAFDRIHPSTKGSRAIAERIAALIRR